MNGEGSQSDRGDPVQKDDNVIRLTDWLGPHEELVPFGPGTDAAPARSTKSDEDGPVPTAEDFWSESSAAVQDALTAPRTGHHHPTAGSAPERRGRASAGAIWSRRRARLHAPASGDIDQGRSRHSLPARALIGLAALVTAALVTWGVGTHKPASTGQLDPSGNSEQAERAAHSRSMTSASRSVGRETSSNSPSHAPARRSAAAHHTSSHRESPPHSATSAPAPQPVGYTTAATVTAPATTTAATTSRPYVPSSSTSRATSTANSGSSSATRPALGATGTLAPGSSPDG